MSGCGLNRGRGSRNVCFLPVVRDEKHDDSSSRQGTTLREIAFTPTVRLSAPRVSSFFARFYDPSIS